LLERCDAKSILFKGWQAALKERERQVTATLISAEKKLPIGGRVFCSGAEQLHFENLPQFLENPEPLLRDCLDFFEQNKVSQTKNIQTEHGTFEFFFENIESPVNLIIFGAGADAIPLAEITKALGWRVTVVDHRAAYANAERFVYTDEIIVVRSENLDGNLSVDENSVAVVMTHNYEHDKNILRFLLGSKARYIGALGPKRRSENILREWRDAGENFAEEQLKNLYAPIGLDIGADTPETIALAIVAEIKSVLSNRAGGFLRERKESIYNRNAV
jgi:xanthine dehydrogenase accessory factor